MNSAFYIKVLRFLTDAIQWKLTQNEEGNLILHHENVPRRTSLIVQQFWWRSVPSPCVLQISLLVTYGASQDSKTGLKCHNVSSTEETQQNLTANLTATPRGPPEVLPAIAWRLEQVCVQDGRTSRVTSLVKIKTEFQLCVDPPTYKIFFHTWSWQVCSKWHQHWILVYFPNPGTKLNTRATYSS